MIEFKIPRLTDVLYIMASDEYIRITSEEDNLLYAGPVNFIFREGQRKLLNKLHCYEVYNINYDTENYIHELDVRRI